MLVWSFVLLFTLSEEEELGLGKFKNYLSYLWKIKIYLTIIICRKQSLLDRVKSPANKFRQVAKVCITKSFFCLFFCHIHCILFHGKMNFIFRGSRVKSLHNWTVLMIMMTVPQKLRILWNPIATNRTTKSFWNPTEMMSNLRLI